MKFLIQSLLLASCASLDATKQSLASQFNLTQIEEDVKHDIVVQMMQQNLNALIEEKVNQRVQEAINIGKLSNIKELDDFENLLIE